MYKKLRTAVDVQGNRVEITEAQDQPACIRDDGSINYAARPKYFGPDGRRLIPEGNGHFRSMWGVEYRLID
jgi:hypothetical protein